MDEENEVEEQKSGNSVTNTAKDIAKEKTKEKIKKEAGKKAAQTAAKTATKGAAKAAATGSKLLANASLALPLGPILIWVIIIVVAIIIIVGVIMFVMTAPGSVMQQVKDFAVDLGNQIASYYGADTTKLQVTDEQKYKQLDYLEQMGYDIKGYGFISKNAKESDPNYDYQSGVVRDPETGLIAEAYSDILGIYFMSDNYVYTVKNFNKTGILQFLDSAATTFLTVVNPWLGVAYDNISSLFVDKTQWGRGLISIYFEDGRPYEKNIVDDMFGTSTTWTNIKIVPEEKSLTIRRGWGANYYKYNLDGWTGRYGMPLDFLISLHIATMKPDLAYDMVTQFNTDVKIILKDISDNGSEVISYYKTDSGKYVSFPEIEKALTGLEGRNWASASVAWFDDLGINEEEAKAVYDLGLPHAEECDCEKKDDGTIKSVGGNCKAKIKEILSALKDQKRYNLSTYVPYISRVTDHWFRDVYFEMTEDEAKTVGLINTDLDYERFMNERWTLYETYTAEEDPKKAGEYKLYVFDEDAENGIGDLYEGTQDDADKEGIAVVKKPVTTTIKDLEESGIVTWDGENWSAYESEDISSDSYEKAYPEEDENTVKGKIYYKSKINETVVQKEDGVRAVTNTKIKKMFLENYYFNYDGSSEIADAIAAARKKLDMDYGPVDEDDLDTTFTSIVGKTKDSEGEEKEFKVSDLVSKVSLTQDSLAAFSMLENTHTLDADYIYKDFKELIVELGYFTKEELSEGTPKLLQFLIPEIPSAGYPKRVLDKKEKEYGTQAHSKEDYEANVKDELEAKLAQEQEEREKEYEEQQTPEGKKKSSANKVSNYEKYSTNLPVNMDSESSNCQEQIDTLNEEIKTLEDQRDVATSEAEKEEIQTKIDEKTKERDKKQTEKENYVKYPEYLRIFNENVAKHKELQTQFDNAATEEEKDTILQEMLELENTIKQQYGQLEKLNQGGSSDAKSYFEDTGRGPGRVLQQKNYEGIPDPVNGILELNDSKLSNSIGDIKFNLKSDSSQKLQTIGAALTDKDPSEVSVEEFLTAAREVHKVCEDLKFEYCWGAGNSHNSDWGHVCGGLYETLEQAKNGYHRIDCSTFVSYVLQEVGLMEGRTYTGSPGGSDGFYGMFDEYIITIEEAGELQPGDMPLSDTHIQINGEEEGDGQFLQYNAGSGEAIRSAPTVGVFDTATHVIRLPFNGNSSSGDPYEGYEGGEAVVSPVTGILLEYGTYTEEDKDSLTDEQYRTNSDKVKEDGSKYVDEVGYAKILVLNEEISDQLVTCTDKNHRKELENNGRKIENGIITVDDIPEDTKALEDWSDEQKALYGYSLFKEDYEKGGIAGYIVYIDGFRLELPAGMGGESEETPAPTGEGEEGEENKVLGSGVFLNEDYFREKAASGGTGNFTQVNEEVKSLYEPDEVYKLASENQTKKEKVRSELKNIASPVYKFNGTINEETKEWILIKEGTVLGRTLSNEELVSGEDYRQEEYIKPEDAVEKIVKEDGTIEEKDISEVQGNYLRIIMRDLDDTVVENVEDYMKLDEEATKANTNCDWELFYWLPFESGAADVTNSYLEGRYTGPACVSSCSSGEVAIGIVQETSLTSKGMCNQRDNFIPFMKENYPQFYNILSFMDGKGADWYWSDYNGANQVQAALLECDKLDHDGFLEAQMEEAKKAYYEPLIEQMPWLAERPSCVQGEVLHLRLWGAKYSEINESMSDEEIIRKVRNIIANTGSTAGAASGDESSGRAWNEPEIGLSILSGKLSTEDVEQWVRKQDYTLLKEKGVEIRN